MKKKNTFPLIFSKLEHKKISVSAVFKWSTETPIGVNNRGHALICPTLLVRTALRSGFQSQLNPNFIFARDLLENL